jgi:hypothetical protein
MAEPERDILQGAADLQAACESLKDHGDNIARSGRTFHPEDQAKIWTVKVGGVGIGYRLQVFQTYLNRQVFIKVPGYRIADLNKDERAKIMSAVFNVFVHQGSNIPSVDQIAQDCMLLQQQIIPMVLVERQPGLVSIAGGLPH